MPAIVVYLGARLVDRMADARVESLQFTDLLPIVIGLWLATGVQRAIGAYMGSWRRSGWPGSHASSTRSGD